jgi:hypothetical protein
MSTSTSPKIRQYKSISDIPDKYLVPWFKEMRKDQYLVIDDRIAKQVIEAAYNMQLNEIQAKEEAKRHEEELRIMEQQEKQRRERREREQQAASKLPERQLNMMLTGERFRWKCCRMLQRGEWFGHASKCPSYTGTDIEPGLALLKKEYMNGSLIRRVIGEQAYNRLVEFAIPDETWDDCINRLLDNVEANVQNININKAAAKEKEKVKN